MTKADSTLDTLHPSRESYINNCSRNDSCSGAAAAPHGVTFKHSLRQLHIYATNTTLWNENKWTIGRLSNVTAIARGHWTRRRNLGAIVSCKFVDELVTN